MKKTMIIALGLALVSCQLFAKNPATLPQKNAKIYVASSDPKAAALGSKTLEKWGYWDVVPDKKDADYIVDYNIKKTWLITFLTPNLRGRACITNAQTGEAVYTSRHANSSMRAISFNHRKTVIKKLNRFLQQEVG